MTVKEKYGDWALITGASSGIGEEFARRLAADKINLILVARREDRLKKLSVELNTAFGIETVIAAVDLSQDNFLVALKEKVGRREIGILINNAGFGSNGEFSNVDVDHEVKMVKVNCIAPTILTHHFVPPMIERKKGAVIFLGSVVAFQPTPFMATYSATKVFNSFLGESLWYELRKHNIDVLSLNPGGTATEFHRIANSSSGPVPRTAEQVVTTALKALGKKPSVVDGFYNKALSVSSKFSTRKLTVIISGWITSTLFGKKVLRTKNP